MFYYTTGCVGAMGIVRHCRFVEPLVRWSVGRYSTDVSMGIDTNTFIDEPGKNAFYHKILFKLSRYVGTWLFKIILFYCTMPIRQRTVLGTLFQASCTYLFTSQQIHTDGQRLFRESRYVTTLSEKVSVLVNNLCTYLFCLHIMYLPTYRFFSQPLDLRFFFKFAHLK